jgi:hypothetical protein
MKQWFRFSIADLCVACVIATAFANANLIQRDIGSGVQILLRGWPFPAATNHSFDGITIHWIGLSANVVTGIGLTAIATMIVGKLRRTLAHRAENHGKQEAGPH